MENTYYIILFLFLCLSTNSQTETCNSCVAVGTNGLSGTCNSQAGFIQNFPEENLSPWNLVFEEEWNNPNMPFDGPSALWDASIKICSSFDNNTVYKRANLAFNNGTVNLQTKYEPNSVCDYLAGSPPSWQQQYRNYTVPSLFTNIDFGPGKFEIRCKIPKISGQWPAFWLFHTEPGTPYHGQEIDIFEFKQDPLKSYSCEGNCWTGYPDYSQEFHAGRRMIMTSHYDGTNNSISDACVVQKCYIHPDDLSNAFHTYTLIWEEDYLEWFLDGISVFKRARISTPPILPAGSYIKDLTFPDPKIRMKILLGTGVWSTQSNYNTTNYPVQQFCGPPLTPNDFLVDYVKVWERSCGTGNRTLNYTYDPDYFYDRNNAVVKAQNVYFESNTWPKWELNAGQKLRTGATNEIKIVNFEAKLGSEFVATITNCGNLSYRKSSNQQVLSDSTLTKANTSLLTIIPNPSSGNFKVLNDKVIKQLDIYTTNGKVILSLSEISKKETSITLNHANYGLYLLRVIDIDGNVSFKKILIE